MSDKIQKGWLTNISGKAFAIASVLALCIPLASVFQGVGILPGDYLKDGYIDYGREIVQVIEDWQKPAVENESVAVLIPTSFNESFDPPSNMNADRIFDSEITFTEGWVGLFSAAGLGLVSSVIANSDDRRAAKYNEAVKAKIEQSYGAEYLNLKQRYLGALPEKYNNSITKLSSEDLGILAAMDDKDLIALPDWMQSEVMQAQRDIALAALHTHDLEGKLDIRSLSDIDELSDKARFEIFRQQRDRVWDTIYQHTGETRKVQELKTGQTTALAGGLSLGILLGDGDSNAAAGAGAAIAILAVAAIVGGCVFLSAKGVYDNFIKEDPELLMAPNNSDSKLISAKKLINEARNLLSDKGYQTAVPAVAPMPV